MSTFRQTLPYSFSGSMRSRSMLFSTAWPARPKKATPSCTSAAIGRYLSRKMSASGWPVPITGACAGW